MNPLRAIREKCLDCTCQQPVKVNLMAARAAQGGVM